MVIGRKETVWVDFAKVMVIGIVSNLEFMLHTNLRKLSFKNADFSHTPRLYAQGKSGKKG